MSLATGTTATVSSPSTSATRVLKTRSGETPRASAASSPYEGEAGSCSYAWTVYAVPAAVRATVAGVPPVCFLGFFATGGVLDQLGWVGARVRSVAGREGRWRIIAVSRRSSVSSSRSRVAVSGAWSSRCFVGTSRTVAAATR